MTKRLITVFMKSLNRFNITVLATTRAIWGSSREKIYQELKILIFSATTVVEEALSLFQKKKKTISQVTH